jgi:hypothetical protein
MSHWETPRKGTMSSQWDLDGRIPGDMVSSVERTITKKQLEEELMPDILYWLERKGSDAEHVIGDVVDNYFAGRRQEEEHERHNQMIREHRASAAPVYPMGAVGFAGPPESRPTYRGVDVEQERPAHGLFKRPLGRKPRRGEIMERVRRLQRRADRNYGLQCSVEFD